MGKKANPTNGGLRDALAPRAPGNPFEVAERDTHVYGPGDKKWRCATDSRGYATPGGKTPDELVIHATDGFIPLWGPNVVLHWRFHEASMGYFENPGAAKEAIEGMFARGILAWGDAAPVTFKRTNDVWDFQIRMAHADDCDDGGCVLASAFFPDGGRHTLDLYPILFKQTEEEIIETFAHEIGHVFGLRHFFAKVSETAWPSEIFGKHHKFTIMNYGSDSRMTAHDRSDLEGLYTGVWDGIIEGINRTPVVQVRPYHELRSIRREEAVVMGRSPAIRGGRVVRAGAE
ncbi:matrixin family metalloprotease [Sandaracinus amylolyticus]|uniref:matrixin family metalloprotease n=1 Tax=Sandaracinus amylolyticus TaxID=927083 RepID=UPI001F1CBC49|nr:matrixin family metalloprotease [Sandaracinus amylolyticus]UJR83144.1 Hypothetical protein I5071_52100 [Sandaracinus amylolyticus]